MQRFIVVLLTRTSLSQRYTRLESFCTNLATTIYRCNLLFTRNDKSLQSVYRDISLRFIAACKRGLNGALDQAKESHGKSIILYSICFPRLLWGAPGHPHGRCCAPGHKPLTETIDLKLKKNHWDYPNLHSALLFPVISSHFFYLLNLSKYSIKNYHLGTVKYVNHYYLPILFKIPFTSGTHWQYEIIKTFERIKSGT